MQYKFTQGDGDCKGGCHLHFETLGNLSSAVWRQNAPLPAENNSEAVGCAVSYGEHPLWMGPCN